MKEGRDKNMIIPPVSFDRQSFEELESWFAKPMGNLLLETEKTALNHLLSSVYGYHLLQIGGPAHFDLLSPSKICHRIHLSRFCPCGFAGSCVTGDFEELPFASGSMDLIVMPHVLEFAAHPQRILQEAYRILIPEGNLILLGFHYYSLWGLAKLFKSPRTMPWCGKFYSSYRVRDWLEHQDYGVEDHKTLFFRPPLFRKEELDRWLFLEAMGQMIWPYLGGVYLIVAKKHVTALTPKRSLYVKKRASVKQSMAQPTARIES